MDQIDQIRAFNRSFTRRIGLLNTLIEGKGRTLTELRILRDIHAEGDTLTAGQICRDLGLDEGYVSRVISRFAESGLVERLQDPKDARKRRLTLTEKGYAEVRPLIDTARRTVEESIAHLDAAQRADLLAAMHWIEQLLDDAGTGRTPEIRLRGIQPGDAGWITYRHGLLYARDEGFDASFETLVARILADFLEQHQAPRERGWIAEDENGNRLGCIFCVRHDERTAQLRLFLVEPSARRQGLGRRLLNACLDHARDHGFDRMILWTHKSHKAACALYAASGFRMVGEKPTVNFGRNHVEQHWEITL